METTLSLSQFQITLGQPEANLALAAEWIAEAASRGSQFVLFPELWSTGYDLPNAHRYATPLGEGPFAQVARLAGQNHINIGGSMLEAKDGRVYNTFTLYGADGNLLAVYRKIHLFKHMDEDRYLSAGDALQMADTSFGRVGLSICYDLRFPEMFRHYAVQGARLLLISAEWPVQRTAHWQIMLRSRAIENQAFVAATNCCGTSGADTFGGYSAVISPWGEPIVEGNDEPCLLTTTINYDSVDRARRKIDILADRRPDLYG